MKKFRWVAVLLFAVVAWADNRVHDRYGMLFWTVATVIFAGLALFGGKANEKTDRTLAYVQAVLVAFAVVVFFLRIVFGYAG